MPEPRKLAAALAVGAALVVGAVMAPSGAQAAPAAAGTAAAATCPATVAEFVYFASPRGVGKYINSTLVSTSVVSGKLQCHFVGTAYAAVPGRPPIVTPNVAWSRPASVF